VGTTSKTNRKFVALFKQSTKILKKISFTKERTCYINLPMLLKNTKHCIASIAVSLSHNDDYTMKANYNNLASLHSEERYHSLFSKGLDITEKMDSKPPWFYLKL
jgi:hypothetical protein